MNIFHMDPKDTKSYRIHSKIFVYLRFCVPTQISKPISKIIFYMLLKKRALPDFSAIFKKAHVRKQF